MAVASGAASLSAEDRAELLAVLAGDGDKTIAERAQNALLSQQAEAFLSALKREDAAPELFRYCAESLLNKAGIADAMARHASCPAGALVATAHYLSAATVQTLLDDLDHLTRVPAAAAALASNPNLTAEQRVLVEELKKETAEEDHLADMVSFEADPTRRESLLQRLARMRVVERVQLALKGNREERMALIRDPCRVVQRAVLQSSKLSDTEVEGYAAMASLTDEILRNISMNRGFAKNYMVIRNLINNAKTPLDVSLHLLPRLTIQDLKVLTMNKNVPETLRSMAAKLYRQRTQAQRG